MAGNAFYFEGMGKMRPMENKIGAKLFKLLAVCSLVWIALFAYVADAQMGSMGYSIKSIQGWTVHFNDQLLTKAPEVYSEVLPLLDNRLYGIRLVVGEAALAELQKVPIWVELNDTVDTRDPLASYFPHKEMMQKQNLNVEKAQSIELSNAANFVVWSKKSPSSILFLLMANAYHDRVVHYENPELIALQKKAAESRRYDLLLNIQGTRSNGLTAQDPRTYFAMLSQAYLDVSSYYPFVRGEIKEWDPEMYAFLVKAWGQ
jgi:hypothetical protein